MSRLTSAIGPVTLALSIIIVGACAAKPPVDIPLTGTISAADDLNPALDGRPSPLRISIFQLRKADAFGEADFFALYDDAAAALGADLLAREDMTLKPGDTRKYSGEVDPETRFIGVIGAYRDINQARWSSVVAMPEKSVLKLMKREPLRIEAGRLAIEVSTGN